MSPPHEWMPPPEISTFCWREPVDPALLPQKMGIERVLNWQFGDRLEEVIQVDPKEEEGGKQKTVELTIEVMQVEVNQILTAIVAIGERCAW